MITIYNDRHYRHQGKLEMFRGDMVPCFEVADRAERVLAELRRRRLGAVREPDLADERVSQAVGGVHAGRYLEFLRGAWDEWVALDPQNRHRDALPSVWPVRGMRSDRLPDNFAARLGLFSFDVGTPLTAGTWDAAWGGAACAVSAAGQLLAGERSAFALTRPPGHHAGRDFFGGYCFINNAAVAAQALRDGGVERVAIVDVDYHHGNGTQEIFYRRADVLFASIHGDPATEYPFFLGYPDEQGEGEGLGYNLNLPLPHGTGFPAWREALSTALHAVADFRAGALVVSLGLDTFRGDPISGFQLDSEDYVVIGEMLASLRLPTVFILEGGYALEAIGENAINVLDGFDSLSSGL